MRFLLRLFRVEILSLDIEPDEPIEDFDEELSDAHLHAALTIGFSPDPVFPDLIWEDENEEV